MNATPLRVAHVDDDEDLRALVRVALEMDGLCAVASCASGREALRVIPGFQPDIILVDVLMPGMDGMQTIEALRARMPLEDVAVVFATGLEDAAQLDALYRAGDAVIAKPFNALTLAGRLQALRGP